jgi:hypothetical protein
MIVPGLTTDELSELTELQEVHQLATSNGWRTRLLPLLESLVAEASEEMLGAVFATVEVKASLLTRWQQRQAVLRSVVSYIQSCEDRRKMILEGIEQRRKEETAPEGVPLEETYAGNQTLGRWES